MNVLSLWWVFLWRWFWFGSSPCIYRNGNWKSLPITENSMNSVRLSNFFFLSNWKKNCFKFFYSIKNLLSSCYVIYNTITFKSFKVLFLHIYIHVLVIYYFYIKNASLVFYIWNFVNKLIEDSRMEFYFISLLYLNVDAM